MRVDEGGCEHEPGPVDDALPAGVDLRRDLDDRAALDADVERRVDPLGRVEHARAADDEVGAVARP